jgi:hypothetical protein
MALADKFHEVSDVGLERKNSLFCYPVMEPEIGSVKEAPALHVASLFQTSEMACGVARGEAKRVAKFDERNMTVSI